VAQGFSLGCPVNDGYSMATGDIRRLNDPKFTIALPNVNKGETKHLVLDLFAWESDHSTEETKRLFTNEAATKLMEIYEVTKKRKKKTQEKMIDWIESDDNEIVNALVSVGVTAASVVTPYVTVARAGIKIFSIVQEVIKSNSDDFLGTARASVIYTRLDDGRLLYRWIFNNGVESWFEEERPVIHQSWRIFEANRDNELDCKFIIQIAAESPNEFTEPAD